MALSCRFGAPIETVPRDSPSQADRDEERPGAGGVDGGQHAGLAGEQVREPGDRRRELARPGASMESGDGASHRVPPTAA
jgi:hypothetical protein